MPESLIHIDGLKTYFHTEDQVVRAVDDISLDIAPGHTLGLVGESGSGKSVTSLSIMRLLPRITAKIESGSISFLGKDIVKLSESEMTQLRGGEISMIFQDPVSALSPLLSIGDQISDVYRYSTRATKREGWDRALSLLEALGIETPDKVARRYPHQMSGGMAQRINIAMALVCEPQSLLADEPTTGLDVTTQMQVLELLSTQLSKRQASLLFVSHDLRVIAKICEKVGVMYGGLLMEFGGSDEVFSSPAHPYTQRLLECATIDEGVPPRSIPGSVPKLDMTHDLCPFRNRCNRKLNVCDHEAPPPKLLSGDHISRCHLDQ